MNGVGGTTDPTPYELFGPLPRLVGITVDAGCHEY